MPVKKTKTSFDYSAIAALIRQVSEDGASCKLETGLYVVATPIGNLGDLTLRALRVLDAADVIACEDTRVTGALLQHYGLRKSLISCHDHNEEARATDILQRLENGQAVALVSDAGTPLLSDPGYKLVNACKKAGHKVFAIPGASALLCALTVAGLPTDRFLFAGFLPTKSKARRDCLTDLAAEKSTLVFYETAPRLAESLKDMAAVLGQDRQAVVTRELTKMFEETKGSTLAELAEAYREAKVKGEIVIVVGPPPESDEAVEDVDDLLRKALKNMSLRDSVTDVSEATGMKKGDIYKRALSLQNARSKA